MRDGEGDEWGAEMKGRWGRGPWFDARSYGTVPGDAWGEFWSGFWRGPAPRAERGVIRYVILAAIAQQPRHGYEIIQAIVEKTGGAYRPSPGVIYPTLQMLEEMGFARTTMRDDRKVYEITADGKAELRAHEDDVRDFYDGFKNAAWEAPADDVIRVMKRIGDMIRTFKRGARRGRLSPGTMRKMRVILDEAIDKLEALFDEDEGSL